MTTDSATLVDRMRDLYGPRSDDLPVVAATQPLRYSIAVYGLPGPQGSKRFVGMRGGRGVMIESSAKVKPWREAVKIAAITARGPLPVLDGPLRVSMVFTLPKPASAPKRRQSWPDKKPDLSKLIRSTEDALTDSGVWRDDARVVEYSRVAKVFPGEDPQSLDCPGVRITIESIE